MSADETLPVRPAAAQQRGTTAQGESPFQADPDDPSTIDDPAQFVFAFVRAAGG